MYLTSSDVLEVSRISGKASSRFSIVSLHRIHKRVFCKSVVATREENVIYVDIPRVGY